MSGNVYDDVEADMAAEQAAGDTPPPEARVPVTLADGRQGTVPASGLDAALGMGATQDDTSGGLMGSLKAGEVAFGSTLAGGLIPGAARLVNKYAVDPLLGTDTDAMFQQNVHDAQEEAKTHQLAHFVGSGLGMAADAIGPIGKGASLVTKSATRGLGAVGMGGAAARIGGAAAGAAGMQAVYETGQQISDAELSKDPITAEQLVAAAPDHLKNILLAGVVGGAFQGLGELYQGARAPKGLLESSPKRSGPVSEATADEIAGVPGAGIGQREAAKAETTFMDDMAKSGATREQAASAWKDPVAAIGEFRGKMNPGIAEALKKGAATKAMSAIEGEAFRNQQIGEFVKAGNSALRDGVDVNNELAFALKHEQVKRTISPEWRPQLDAINGGIRQEAQAFIEHWTENEGGAAGSHFKKFKGAFKQFEKNMETIADRATAAGKDVNPEAAAQMFREADAIKRSMGKVAKARGFQFGEAPIVTDAGFDVAGPGAVNRGARAVYDRMRLVLEDPAVFGQTGELQRAINAPFASGIANEGSALGKLTTVLQKDGFVGVPEIHSAKAASFLDRAGSAEAATDTKSLQDVIDNHILRANELIKHAELEPAEIAKLERGKAAMTNWRKVVDDTVAKSAANAHIRRLVADEGEGLGHGIVGRLADPILRPIHNQMALEHAAHIASSVGGKVKLGLGKLMGWGASAPAKLPAMNPELVAKEIAGVREAAASPDVMAQRTTEFSGKSLTSSAPRLATSVAAVSARAISYLASQAPVGRLPTGISASHDAKPRYSDAELQKWARTTAAIKDPVAVVEQAKHGTLSREGVQAIKAVYPAMYAQMQQQVMGHIVEMDRAGKLSKMPYEQKLMIGILLAVPADGSLTQPAIASMQATKMATPDKPQTAPSEKGGGRRPIDLHTDTLNTQPNPGG